MQLIILHELFSWAFVVHGPFIGFVVRGPSGVFVVHGPFGGLIVHGSIARHGSIMTHRSVARRSVGMIISIMHRPNFMFFN